MGSPNLCLQSGSELAAGDDDDENCVAAYGAKEQHQVTSKVKRSYGRRGEEKGV